MNRKVGKPTLSVSWGIGKEVVVGSEVSIVVEVPRGQYCAVKSDFGLHERCPLLHSCDTQKGAYYCAVVSSDTHLGEDSYGILKHDYAYYVCPSLLGDKLMELCRLKSSKVEEGGKKSE